tara:strand:- start:13868 stop:14440 length:573 start_codon:yes stop_codon:yes gene_type:complete
MLKNLNDKTVILASQSTRRKELLSDLGITFEVISKPTKEIFPSEMKPHLIAEYLAKMKSSVFNPKRNEIIITADTVVIHNNKVYNKPIKLQEAKDMLCNLSNSTHKVITGVCIYQKNNQFCFSELTKVQFKELSEKEINYYLNNFNTSDKAGAYGIQDWIGKIGITSIEGCYYNVMGLPLHKLYNYLIKL